MSFREIWHQNFSLWWLGICWRNLWWVYFNSCRCYELTMFWFYIDRTDLSFEATLCIAEKISASQLLYSSKCACEAVIGRKSCRFTKILIKKAKILPGFRFFFFSLKKALRHLKNSFTKIIACKNCKIYVKMGDLFFFCGFILIFSKCDHSNSSRNTE